LRLRSDESKCRDLFKRMLRRDTDEAMNRLREFFNSNYMDGAIYADKMR
jgi:hypothetical protein